VRRFPIMTALVLLSALARPSEGRAGAPVERTPGLLSFLAGRVPAGKRSGRDRFLLRRRYGSEAPFSIGIRAGGCFLGAGKAGRAVPGSPPRDRPAYREAFGPGFFSAVSGEYAFRPILRLIFRAGFEVYPGRAREEGALGTVRYDDLWIVPLRGGLRLECPLSLPPSSWTVQGYAPPIRGLHPFLEVMFGMAFRPAVDLEPVGSYWSEALVFSAEAGAGAVYRFPGLSIAVCAGLSYHSEPPERVWFAEPEAALAVLVSGEISMRF